MALAFALDRPLAVYLRDSGIAHQIKFAGHLTLAAKAAGYFWFPAGIAAGLTLFHPARWRSAVFLLLCSLVGGTNAIFKWLVGRYRPFKLPPYDVPQPFLIHPFNGRVIGLFHQAGDLSFVSGHTALAFSTAAGMAILFPKHRAVVWLFYAIAGIVFLERVGENAHWLSDATCAAALGVWGVALMAHFCLPILFPGRSK
jgi:membrane-associated phospholipid phosphatase